MKKILALVMVLALLVCGLSACGKKGITMADLEAAGELVVATSPDFPPFEALDGEEIVGIEADVMKIVCEKLGVELKFEQMDFDSVLAGVQAGKYNMGASGISVTPEREKNMLFTTPYCLAAQAIVVKEGSDITNKAGLTGKNIAVQTGTTAEAFCLENNYTVKSYAANSDAQTALTTGKVDAWVIDDLTAKDMVDTYNAENAEKLVILGEAMTTEPYAFAFSKGSEEVVEKIDTILKELVADGTIAKIFEKHNAPYTAPEV